MFDGIDCGGGAWSGKGWVGRIITGERSTIEAFCIKILAGSSGLHDGDDGDRSGGVRGRGRGLVCILAVVGARNRVYLIYPSLPLAPGYD